MEENSEKDLIKEEEALAENSAENVEDLHKEEKHAKHSKKEKKKEKEKDDYKEKFLYLAADMENLKKRQERERQGFIKYGNEKILKDLINVVDNFDRSIDAIKNDEDEKIKNIAVGIEMVKGQFLEVLVANGLQPIESVGKKFDPNFHEALTKQEVEGKEEDEIIAEYQKGYMLNGRLLRASKVVVAK